MHLLPICFLTLSFVIVVNSFKTLTNKGGAAFVMANSIRNKVPTPKKSGQVKLSQGPNEQYIILARHPETAASSKRIVQGWKETIDTRVTEGGHKDAGKLVDTISQCFNGVHEISHCGQQRTKELARYMMQKYPNAKVTQDQDLRGLAFGALEGKSYEQAGIKPAAVKGQHGHTSIADQSWRDNIAHDMRKQIEPHDKYQERAKNSLARVIVKSHVNDCPAGKPYCTFVSGHDWTIREQLSAIASKPGVRDSSGKPEVEGSHASAGYSVIHVKDIHKMPTKPGTNQVDLDKAPGTHFHIKAKMMKAGG